MIGVDHQIFKNMNQSCSDRVLNYPGSKVKWFSTFKNQNTDSTTFLHFEKSLYLNMARRPLKNYARLFFFSACRDERV
jgi:hypothetical protein